MTRGQSRAVFGYDTNADFLGFNPRFRQLHRQYSTELTRLQRALAQQNRAGRTRPCARQIFLEARWLVYYTADFVRIKQRLEALRALLRQPHDPPGCEAQSATDGSFDHCSQAWFLKVDANCEVIEDLAAEGKKPPYPLHFLDRINSPVKLRAYLDSVLISDVRRSGEDKSYEMNIGGTDLMRFITGEIPTDYRFDPQLKQTLLDYLDNRWQDPQTGFFGGWYRTPTGVRKTANLSTTFHIAAYLHGRLKHWPQIIQTTLAMQDHEFPYGWLEEGHMSNHHDFDVVRLLRYGWPDMSETQRAQARVAIQKMLDFCLKETLNPDGSFKMMDEDTVASSYSLPVAFLQEVGYFEPGRRFWTDAEFPQSPDVARRIAAHLRSLHLDDPEAKKTLRLLESLDQPKLVKPSRGWIIGGVSGLLLVGLLWHHSLRTRTVQRSRA